MSIKFWRNKVSKCVLAALAACSLCAPARTYGQVTASQWNGLGDFAYDIQSMPDLDQYRSELDNDGSLHCVPTAVMNLLAFAANFNAPDMPPYPGVWIGAPGHKEMTGWIDWLGQYMGTSGATGTTGSGKVNGLENWIFDSGSPIQFLSRYPKDDYWPTIDDAVLHTTCGAIVQFSYGRYDWQYGTQGPPVLVDRNGGHAVTLKLAFADNGFDSGPRLIHYRDPATHEGDLESNSNFSSVWAATAQNMNIGVDLNGDFSPEHYTMTSLINPRADDEEYYVLDSILAIYPPGGVTVGGNRVAGIFSGGKLGFVQAQIPTPYSTPAGQNLIAAIPHPDQHSTVLLQGVVGKSVRLVQTFHNGRSVDIASVPSSASCLALGFGHDVYMGTGREISVMRLTGKRVATPIRFATAPAPVQLIAVDQDTGSLLAIYGNRAGVATAGPQGTWMDLGACVGVGTATAPFRNVCIIDGVIYAALTNGKVVSCPFPQPVVAGKPLKFAPLTLSGVSNANYVDGDGMHRLYVSDAKAGVLEFERDSAGWTTAKNKWFGAIPLGTRFVPFRNRSNVRAGDLDAKRWYNIDPAELPSLGPDVAD